MISLYTGTPGSGKSLHSARVIYYKLRSNKPVICNFEIVEDNIKNKKGEFLYIDNDNLNPNILKKYSFEYFKDKKVKEDSILLVLDESQLLFNSRDWNKLGRDGWLSFFSQHRHYGYEIILVCQFDRMIDRQIRSLVEYEYIHRKVSNFGLAGKIFSLLFGGKLFVCVKMWYPLKEKISSDFFKASPKYYNLYDTFVDFKQS